MRRLRSDFDIAWKEVLTRYFEPFLLFFFPLAHEQIDWSRPIEFLESELRYAVRIAGRGRRTVDVLARVWKKDGVQSWVLAHVEVQSQPEARFARRMFICNTLLHARHGLEVASFALLADTQADWRPSEYGYDLLGTRTSHQFPVCKLLDYQERWEELEQSDNPFALVVMAHLKTLATARSPESRLEWKTRLLEGLYREGRRPEEVVDLFRFLELVMVLPEREQQQFEREVERQEGARTMPVLTPFERHAMERGERIGIEKGALQTACEDAITVLEVRFGNVPERIAARVNKLEDLPVARHLLRVAMTAATLEEFERGLPLE